MGGKKSVWVWILLGLSAIVLCVALCLAAVIGIRALLCNHETRSPQVVDASPWLSLAWQERADTVADLDLSIFDSYTLIIPKWVDATIYYHAGEGGHPNESYLQVDVELNDNAGQAEIGLQKRCHWHAPDSEPQGNDKGRYCASYVVEEMADPEGLCLPSGLYNSYVVLQKDNLVITVHEWTRDKNSRRKDQVIRLLAEELVK